MSPIELSNVLVRSASSFPPNVLVPSTARTFSASVRRLFSIDWMPCRSWTCAISWASTAATASSFLQQRSMPRETKISPPGVAKALISSESRTRKW